jgi:hypothetical protein
MGKYEMTSRERLLAAINGDPVDTIPVSPRSWRYGMSKGLSKLELAREFDFDAFVFAGGSLGTAVRDTFCKHIKPLLSDVKIEITAERDEQKTIARRTFHTPGGVLHDTIVKPDPGGQYGISPNHEWLEPLVKTADDLELLPYLLPDPAYVRQGFAAMHEQEEQIGEEGLVAYRPITGVDQVVVDAVGPVQALMLSLDNPKMLARAIELVDTWNTEVMKHVLADGWKIIFDAFFNFSLSVGWSPDFYRETVMPIIKAHADLIHSYDAKMFYYDDGKQAKSIGYAIEAGADIIQTLTPPPSGDLDFDWLAKTYGGQTCFNGGIDTVQIRFGGPDEIETAVAELLETLAPTGRFILGTSDENMRAFCNAARKYGKEMALKLYG